MAVGFTCIMILGVDVGLDCVITRGVAVGIGDLVEVGSGELVGELGLIVAVGACVAVGTAGGWVGTLVVVACGTGVLVGWPLQIVPTRLGSIYFAISLVWKEGMMLVTSVPHFCPLCGLLFVPFSYTSPP